jgi:hypothetical protein
MRELDVTTSPGLGPVQLAVDTPQIQVPHDMLNYFIGTQPAGDMNAVCCRLSLTNGTAVTTGNVTGTTTLYLNAYNGSTMMLYDGSQQWNRYTLSATISVTRPNTASQTFDVFVYQSAGALTLETVNWSNDTTRATQISLQDGVYVKATDSTHRYVGTARTDSSKKLNDSTGLRTVWNYNNRVFRELRVLDNTATWNYSTNTWRAGDNTTANQVVVLVGVAEAFMSIVANVRAKNNSGGTAYVGIAEDATNVNNADITGETNRNDYNEIQAVLRKNPPLGYHYYQWVENGGGTATTTYQGNGDAGIFGNIDG